MKSIQVTVIIPYYQKKQGILRRAVSSVFNQKTSYSYEILIADDGSPVSAIEELADLPSAQKEKIRIIEGKNKGPSGARNRALDSVTGSTDYIALLDSDDEWVETHLERAVSALEKGYDFYFADAKRVQHEQSLFGLRRKSEIPFRIEEHRRIEAHLYEFSTSYAEVITPAPTIVYRYSSLKDLRFEELLYNGEITLFWVRAKSITHKVVFSDETQALLGLGVNIWAGTDWGSEKALLRSKSMLLLHKLVLQSHVSAKSGNLTEKEIHYAKVQQASARKTFVSTYLHMLRKNRKPYFQDLLGAVKSDPGLFFSFLRIFNGVLGQKRRSTNP